ncbi:hypothetical protein [Albirhodobacter sp. R86504]|jgi:hypothetical protein|uniref:hypothetical protein n=1 Tax=Albirhodobacter sp. R86504 TaxID=3093848 RepID=UPI00366A8360
MRIEIRPVLRARLYRFREVLAALGAIGLALWVASFGGYFLTPLGFALAALAATWGIIALRRARFAHPVTAPGLVDLDEGRIGYFGAGQGLGGYIEIDDLAEIRLISLRQAPHWRLKSTDGRAIVIPASTTHAEKLYDAFARLPGIDMAVLTNALTKAQANPPPEFAIGQGRSGAELPPRIGAQSLWRRAP